jgi:hypothetical protein
MGGTLLFLVRALLFSKRRPADRSNEACRLGIASPWSEVVFQSDPPATLAAFDAIIAIAEPTSSRMSPDLRAQTERMSSQHSDIL